MTERPAFCFIQGERVVFYAFASLFSFLALSSLTFSFLALCYLALLCDGASFSTSRMRPLISLLRPIFTGLFLYASFSLVNRFLLDVIDKFEFIDLAERELLSDF